MKLLWYLANIVMMMVGGAIAEVPPYACDSRDPATRSYTFCDSSKPITVRVEDLISRLSLEEKISQLGNNASAVPRLGIPKYEWWSEALHGVAVWGGLGINFNGPIHGATSFPQVILTAASFNDTLWYLIGQAIGIEARAIYNAGQASGLTLWAPNVNIFRDPRWGRGQETPGEDPVLSGRYSVAYVRGLQGDPLNSASEASSSTRLRASACCKHYTAYDMDNWEGHTRIFFDAVVSQQDLLDTYQPPFRSCVEEGRASGIMCSYNSLNGVPTCADFNLLNKAARTDWGLQGYVTSDCSAVYLVYTAHQYARTAEDAVAAVLKAGMDVECGNVLQNYTLSAIEQGKVIESDINRALRNLFSVRMRLGLFDGDLSHQLDGKLTMQDVCSEEHQRLALEAARQGIVLLKNSRGYLPLSKTQTKSLAVIGPNANNGLTLLGNYYGPPCNIITPLQGLQKYVANTLYYPGCEDLACISDNLFGEALENANKVDAVVVVVGLDQTQEKEELDRIDLTLPGQQEILVDQVTRAAKSPVVLVIISGGPVDVSFAVNNPQISSIIWAGYPGQAGGQALAEIIFGDYNPGGRLPMTWYPQDFVKIPMTDMNMRPNHDTGYPGRTYRFYTGKKVFDFGQGLSYSTYSYKFSSTTINKIDLNVRMEHVEALDNTGKAHVRVENIPCSKLTFTSSIFVRNHDNMDGSHSVLLYSRSPATHKGVPQKQLIGFRSVHVQGKQTTKVTFEVKPCDHLSTVKENGVRVLTIGSHSLIVGDTQYPVSLVTGHYY